MLPRAIVSFCQALILEKPKLYLILLSRFLQNVMNMPLRFLESHYQERREVRTTERSRQGNSREGHTPKAAKAAEHPASTGWPVLNCWRAIERRNRLVPAFNHCRASWRYRAGPMLTRVVADVLRDRCDNRPTGTSQIGERLSCQRK